MIFSCIIPASKKDAESQNLKDLIASIKAQDFPQDQIEILVITEGDSESAKAIGIRRAKGEICAMFCADNYIIEKEAFSAVKFLFDRLDVTGIYSKFYAYKSSDNSLNRYFSLMGCNDPIAFYLKKADRKPWYYQHGEPVAFDLMAFTESIPSLGDNGFYVNRDHLLNANLDHYYPMDAFDDLRRKGYGMYLRTGALSIWHRTSENLISFLKKRYRYARDLYCDRADRRWKMVDTAEDRWRIVLFVAYTATILPALYTSIRGYRKIPDVAWFWHWPVCFGFLITYSILAIRNLFKHGRLFQCPQSA